ncbi:histidine kinase [Chryseobacterium sp. G0240]|uniref:FecR family protein n=1 Tax=Chryseobacterium sp. G0240 TaxID=2487066 RepID=UPI000F45D335|nr:FecR family protein [Chryseobacterium sp. G0240]ROI02523.1 histidine kinase [Chryseobacterium sp. G0240]
MEEKEDMPFLTKEFENKIWDEFFKSVRHKKKQKRIRRFRVYTCIGVLVLIACGILTYNRVYSPSIYIARDNNISIILPDKSEVILQKGSKLTVEKSFPSDTRDVTLEGDALFKVSKSKDHPFIVHGNGYETKVLGTVFKISQSGKLFLVDLYEGKVQVKRDKKSSETYVLHPKETFSNMGTPEIAAVMKTETKDHPKIIGDARVRINFSECPIDVAINVIEKNYGIKINYPAELSGENLSITGQNAGAEDIIKAIALQFNLNIKKINATTFELEN